VNRVLVLNVRADTREWLAWAGTNDVRQDIISFIAVCPDALCRAPGEDGKPFSSPRSWVALSRALDRLELTRPLNIATVRALSFGLVTASDAATFSALRLEKPPVFPIIEYVDHPALLPEEGAARWVVLNAIRAHVAAGALNASADDLERFLEWLPNDQQMAMLVGIVPAWRKLGVGRTLDAIASRVGIASSLARAEKGLARVGVRLPELAGLACAARISCSARIPTAGVFRSGRIVIGGPPHGGDSGGWSTEGVNAVRERIDPETADKTEALLGFTRIGAPVGTDKRRAVPKLGAFLSVNGGTLRHRTWARPSRRDAMRPGRERLAPTLGIVLDTSSSMLPDLEKALSVLRWLVEQEPGVRVIECDGAVRLDKQAFSWPASRRVACGGDREIVTMPHPCKDCGVRHAYRVKGADTDLDSALDRLERDPTCEEIVVLTDGYVRACASKSKRRTWVLSSRCSESLLPAGDDVIVLD
jgi:hypothetical protein